MVKQSCYVDIVEANMTNRGAEVNHQQAKSRSDAYFLLYASMGSKRSLSKLRDLLADLGLDISLNTLKTYSSNYGWGERLEIMPAPSNEGDALMEFASSMAERQSELGRTMQYLASERLKTVDPNDLGVNEIVRLMDIGVRIERLAMGEAIERVEIFTNTIQPIIIEMCNLFTTINAIPDEEQRLRQFATGADEIINHRASLLEKKSSGKSTW